jgi:twitching motility protein PilT
VAVDLDQILRQAVDAGASDIHLKPPSPPRMRLAGELIPMDGLPPLSITDADELRLLVLRSELKQKQFESSGSADLSYNNDFGRFRVAVLSQRGSTSFIFRVIAEAPEATTLGLPPLVLSWSAAREGLVVITGPTGAGKSTTSAALLRIINETRPCHIMTIEDPIEFLHTDARALVTQREIGLDADNYPTALRAALRADPDVILVGEVRDEETAITALRAAETGHLVMCTMHTTGAAETVQRFADLFTERSPELARQMLASTLVGIVSQRLVPRSGGGLVLNAEAMLNSDRMRDAIAKGSTTDIHQVIAEGEYYGMQTFDQDLMEKVRDGSIDRDQAVSYAVSPHDFKLRLAGAVSSAANADFAQVAQVAQ